jgi:hypothetical protein
MEIQDPEMDPGRSHFRRKPPKTSYRVRYVPKGYAAQVQLSSVLRPDYGTLRTDADIIAATAWTRQHWHKRAEELVIAECPPFWAFEAVKSRYSAALGCPVTFVMIYGKKKRPCGMPVICPFCWARGVREQWMKVDAAFFPTIATKRRIRVVDTDHKPTKSSSFTHSVKDGETAVKSQYDLVRRVITFHLPKLFTITGRQDMTGHEDFRMPAISCWLDSYVRGWPSPVLHRIHGAKELLKAAGPCGGLLEAVSFRRRDNDAAPWEVQIKQLVMAADGSKIPWSKGSVVQNHVVIPKPRRRAVVSAVARTLHYPSWLLRPDTPIEQIIEYLTIRRDLRLVANYGRFRNKHT